MLHTSPHTGERWFSVAERRSGGNCLPSTRRWYFRPSGPIPVLYSDSGGAVSSPCLSSTIHIQCFWPHQCSFPDGVQYTHRFIISGTSCKLHRYPATSSVLAQRRLPSFSLKMLKATMIRRGRGKVEFTPSSQTYIDLVDTTANLEHIMAVLHRRWGSDYVLVTSDGLELEDSPATQGCY